MMNFHIYQIDEWVEDGLTVPLHEKPSREQKRKNPTPWVVGLAATVAFAFTSRVLVNTGETADVQSERIAVATAVHGSIDADLIVGSPSDYWAKAINDVRRWKIAPPDEGVEPPSVI